MSLRFSSFNKILLALFLVTCAATAAQAQYYPYGPYHDHYHRAYRGPEVVIGGPIVVGPVWAPAPVTVYQQPATVTMTCASGQTISVTGTGSFPHLLNRANKICAARYPAYTPVIVQGAPQGSSYCREYQTTTSVGGARQEAYGTACEQPDGSWQIKN